MADGMQVSGRRRAAAVAAIALVAFWPTGPASADCLDWEEAATQVIEGALDAVPGVGRVSYRIAHSYAGFNHALGAVEVRWTDAGAAMRQMLFHGIHDRPPAALARNEAGLAISLQYCEHGAEECRTQTAMYVYDPVDRRFAGADARAREFAATSCQ